MKKLANDDVIFNTNDLPIEKCPFFELIMNFVNSKPSNKYKSPMIALLVRNYDNLTPSYECFLKDILFRLHSPGADNYAYYELLLGLCLKDQETALFLNKHRLVGRIMDMTLLGIVGDSLRDQLLKTLPDDGRMHIPVK